MAPLDHVDGIELQATEVPGNLHDSLGVRASPGPGQPLASEGQPAGMGGRDDAIGRHDGPPCYRDKGEVGAPAARPPPAPSDSSLWLDGAAEVRIGDSG